MKNREKSAAYCVEKNAPGDTAKYAQTELIKYIYLLTFHNIMLDRKISRNWNATMSKPHAWGMKGWNVKECLFGGREVYDDYDSVYGTGDTVFRRQSCEDGIQEPAAAPKGQMVRRK